MKGRETGHSFEAKEAYELLGRVIEFFLLLYDIPSPGLLEAVELSSEAIFESCKLWYCTRHIELVELQTSQTWRLITELYRKYVISSKWIWSKQWFKVEPIGTWSTLLSYSKCGTHLKSACLRVIWWQKMFWTVTSRRGLEQVGWKWDPTPCTIWRLLGFNLATQDWRIWRNCLLLSVHFMKNISVGDMLSFARSVGARKIVSSQVTITRVGTSMLWLSIDKVVYTNNSSENGRTQMLQPSPNIVALMTSLPNKVSKSKDLVLDALAMTYFTVQSWIRLDNYRPLAGSKKDCSCLRCL